ncbi:M50 family metallopeptidase [Actinophytocola oryzae]|uniref:RIP metalloprotease RseP n=1 Tax=Actinophytocola oryzae TaxID=502181 RepID=A0A4R7UR69_9PSEU|nr:site-2 protease family protein [Actinophytocola oryzae]TDV34533.1 RIP metalloprotease RseP [Actinophytocola oryzae]
MLAYIIGVVLFALCIGASLALHEAGHLLSAKAFGMKVRRYFVGFGPRIWSFHRGGTEYGLKAIPLGGFCEIAGMTTLDEVDPADEPRAMWRQKTWKRTAVMATGPLTHFVLGFVLLYVMALTFGLPNVAEKPVLAQVAGCVHDASTTAQLTNQKCAPGESGPARSAGLRPGDEVLSVGGVSTPTWTSMVSRIQDSSGPTAFVVMRGDETLRLTVDVPKVDRPVTGADGRTEVAQVGVAGVTATTSFDHDGWSAVGGTASFAGTLFSQTFDKLLEFPQRIPAVVHAIFGGERDPETPVSVVGASRIGGEAVEAGLWQLFLLLLAGLNFFMGVFNLLPLLPLDGGHIAIVWYEHVRNWLRDRRGQTAAAPVDYTKLSGVTMVLVLIGGAVMLLTITADIVNPIRITQ